MTREETYSLAMDHCFKSHTQILELPTGYGKTKLAIDLANKTIRRLKENKIHNSLIQEYGPSVLILVAYRTHIDNWKDEIQKWGGLDTKRITFSCYESLHKYEKIKFDIVIADEAHHLQSDNRMAFIKAIDIKYKFICLSATLPKELAFFLKKNYDTNTIKVTLQDAIDNDVLPSPRIILIPMELSAAKETELVDLNTCIDNFRAAYEHQGKDWLKFKWLNLCGKRLKLLSQWKEPFIKDILKKYKNFRTLTFCSSIEQTKELGKNCINSQNKKYLQVLKDFNDKKIKHLTACAMLNEGVNLKDCQYGIFANLTNSEKISVQRIGRILRHRKPVLFIPFYRETRDEDLVRNMIKDYDQSLIQVINSQDFLNNIIK